MCFGCSKEPSYGDGSFEYPQHMYWLRNKKNNFPLHSYLGACRLMNRQSGFEILCHNLLETSVTMTSACKLFHVISLSCSSISIANALDFII